MLWGGREPASVFPSSYGEVVYYYEKLANNPTGKYDVTEDYVVCVLRDRLGDRLGWLGTTTYDDNWDGGSYWSQVGYPNAVGGGSRPAWELWFRVANSWHPGFFEEGTGLDIETFASLTFWRIRFRMVGRRRPSAGPYVVAVVSAEGSMDPNITDWSVRTGNWLAGGYQMPDLVNQATGDYA
jgi:hypothetical protein